MKIRIEFDDEAQEEEVIIRCRSLNEEVQRLQKAVAEIASGSQRLVFYKGETEYYLQPDKILFFETEAGSISVHTADDVYQSKYKLYELEELLPTSFMRISKSAILNVNKIYSMTKNISNCLIQFQHTHKQVYVSRAYFKPLQAKLEEKRMR